MKKDTGIIVLGHGSRLPEANKQLKVLAGYVDEILGGETRVEACYMVCSSPTLMEGISTLAEEGLGKIIVVPVFLSSGLHVKEDIPEQLNEAKRMFPDVEILYAENLGPDRRLAEIVAERIREVDGDGIYQ